MSELKWISHTMDKWERRFRRYQMKLLCFKFGHRVFFQGETLRVSLRHQLDTSLLLLIFMRYFKGRWIETDEKWKVRHDKVSQFIVNSSSYVLLPIWHTQKKSFNEPWKGNARNSSLLSRKQWSSRFPTLPCNKQELKTEMLVFGTLRARNFTSAV